MNATSTGKDPLAYVDPLTQARLEENKQKNGELLADRKEGDIKVVCSTPQGRRFIWDILDFCGVYGTSFVPGMADATAFNEGKRAVGIRLVRQINSSDKSLLQRILLEHWSEEQSKKLVNEKISRGES